MMESKTEGRLLIGDSEVDDEDSEDIAIGKLEFWNIIAHVQGKEINISVGDATQRVKWLGHVAIARWDDDNCQGWKRLGAPVAIRGKVRNGEELDMTAIIREVLENGDHIYVSTSLTPAETS